MNTIIAIAIVALATITGDKPYSIRIDSPPPINLVAMCQNDENCMDIELIDVDRHEELVAADCLLVVEGNDTEAWIVTRPTPKCMRIQYPK